MRDRRQAIGSIERALTAHMEEAAGRTTFGMPTTSPWCYTLQGHGPCRDLFVGIDEGAQVTEITRARRATGGHARQCDAPPRGSGTATKFRFLESCTEGVGEVGRTGLGTGATKGRPLFNVAPGAAGGGVRCGLLACGLGTHLCCWGRAGGRLRIQDLTSACWHTSRVKVAPSDTVHRRLP